MSVPQLVRFSPSAQLSTQLEQVFLYTIELLQQMDHGITYGIAPIAPKVLLWMIEKCEPEAFAELESHGFLSEFHALLEHYRWIRTEAINVEMERLLEFEAETNCDGNNWGHVSLDDISKALSRSTLHQEHPEIARFLERVLSAARERSHWFWRSYFHEVGQAEAELAHEARKPHASVLADAVTSTSSVEVAIHENGPLKAAVAHARDLLLHSDIGHCDDYWKTVYAEVVGHWVEHDLPLAVAAVLQRGEAAQFFDSIGQFINEMREVERLWDMLSPQLRDLLLCLTTAQDAVNLIQQVVRIAYSQKDEEHANRLAVLVVEMLFRRGTSCEPSESLPVLQTTQNTPLVQSIREIAPCETVGYLVSTVDLPHEIRGMSSEPYALVVKVDPTQDEDFPDNIPLVRERIDVFMVEQSEGALVRMLALSPYFWCGEDNLLLVLERFRLALPVLYVCEKQTVFVEYPCSYFSIHSRIHDRQLTRDVFKRVPEAIGGGFYSGARLNCPVIVPLIVDSIVDCGCQQTSSKLSDAYKETREIRFTVGTDDPVAAAFAELHASATLARLS